MPMAGAAKISGFNAKNDLDSMEPKAKELSWLSQEMFSISDGHWPVPKKSPCNSLVTLVTQHCSFAPGGKLVSMSPFIRLSAQIIFFSV